MGVRAGICMVRKPHLDDSTIYNTGELESLCLLSKDELKDNPLYFQLSRYLQKIRVRVVRYDIRRICADFSLSEGTYICDEGDDSTLFLDPDNNRTVEIPAKDIEQKYLVDRIETLYAYESEDVRAWKNDGQKFRNWFHGMLFSLSSVDAQILYIDTILAFNEAFPDDSIPELEPTDDNALFYWEGVDFWDAINR